MYIQYFIAYKTNTIMFCNIALNIFIVILISKTYCFSNNFVKLKIIDDVGSKEDYPSYDYPFAGSPKNRRFVSVETYREKLKVAALTDKQHADKVKVITNFIKDNYLTTNYLYNEVQRIKRTRQVKDELRKMVEYLEQKGEEKMKQKVLECYSVAKKNEVKPMDLWKSNTNNLVINILRDPYNDGFIN